MSRTTLRGIYRLGRGMGIATTDKLRELVAQELQDLKEQNRLFLELWLARLFTQPKFNRHIHSIEDVN